MSERSGCAADDLSGNKCCHGVYLSCMQRTALPHDIQGRLKVGHTATLPPDILHKSGSRRLVVLPAEDVHEWVPGFSLKHHVSLNC